MHTPINKWEEVESGTVTLFNEIRGFGFIGLDAGGRLFFYITEVLKAGYERLDPGMRVKFTRGRAKDGRTKVSRFLEVNGSPAGSGSYSVIEGRFVLHKNEVFVEGKVESFVRGRAFGFAIVAGKSVMIHVGQQGHGSPDCFLPYRAYEARPVTSAGDAVWLTIVPGKPGTGGKASKWMLKEKGADPIPQPEPQAALLQNPGEGSRSETVTCEPQPVVNVVPEVEEKPIRVSIGASVPTTSVETAPRVLPEREWIEVSLRKIRRDRVSYADSSDFGQIEVPWPVLMNARITSMKKGDVFQVKCTATQELPTAYEIRRR